MKSVPVTPNGEAYLIHYVLKFFSYLWQVSGFLLVLPVSTTNETDSDCHDTTEILLKVALNTLKLIFFSIYRFKSEFVFLSK
jgi:hypothetical protein